MQAPARPPNERARLRALRALHILDTPPEARFDRLARLASRLFQVPIALVSLVDEERQWFKARVGLEALETPRDISFCGHAVAAEAALVVGDAAGDSRFQDNPLVTGHPNIRFYAGQPLRGAEGEVLGTLCLIDRAPRTFSQDQLDLLRELADLVEQELQQREVTERFRVIFEQSSDAHLLFDEGGIIDCNAAAVAMLRCTDKAHLISLHPSALSPEFQPDGSRSDAPTHWREEEARARGCCRFEWMHRTQDGEDFLTEVSLTPVMLNGRPVFMEVWHDLTARKRHEDALRESEQRTRFLLEHTTDLIARHDPAGRFTFVTPSVQDLLGYAPEEMLGRVPTDFQDPEDRPALQAAYQVLLKGSALRFIRFPVRHKDGRRVWMESQANPVMDEATGRVREVVITSRDVTASVTAEEELRTSELRFRTMVESLHEAVFLVSRDGRILSPNRRAQEMLGILPEELDTLIGPALKVETFHEDGRLCPPEERPSARAFRSGEAQRQMVLGLRRRDGKRFWILVNAEPLRQEGEVDEVIVSFSDITALREGEARNRAMVEAIPDELFRQDRDGVYLDVHSKDASLPFWPKEAMVGRGMADLLGPEVASRRLEAIRRAMDTGEVQVLEYSLAHEGRNHDFEARVVPYAADETITIVRDITERNAADRLKREFVSTVSHELRTPLTAIRGALGMLAARPEGLPAESQELLDIALRNGQRLLGLVNDILDLDKVEQGTLDFHMEVQPLKPLVEQAVEALRPYAQGLGGGFALALGSEAAALVDAARMLQVLTNLLGNAIKFSPVGEAVRVRLERRGDGLLLEVENGGPGIPPAFRPRIFQKFAQADSSDARRYPGTGLGLAISKALVERMGGAIGFESEPGSTVFSVAFPITQDPPEGA